ncbi:hypothetical protein CAP36_01220 [Chitinophagaceae bacterium IBVUCB2]|nr:hypothetical protein CAP36_01220 [Chitinophagaceae bacterium IBVUCB2]
MKSIKTNIKGVAAVFIGGLLLSSCEKTFDARLPLEADINNKSIVQVYMAMVNTARNYVYVDSKPVTGGAMVLGSVFPTTGYGFSVPSGTRSFLVRDTSSTATQIPLSFAQDLKVGKHYTVFMYDTLNSPKQKTVEDNIVPVTDTTARLRFANFVYSKTAIPAVDVYSANKKANIFTNVQVTDVTDFIPYETNRTDTFYLRLTGTTTNLQNITPPTPAPGNVLTTISFAVTPREKRYYTLIFRGSYATILTSSTQVRGFGFMTNY